MMKLARQPSAATISGTHAAVRMMPTFAPALNNPVAKLRSFRGNHSATDLIDAGKLPASPSPRRKRVTDMPMMLFTKPCKTPAMLHTVMLIEKPRRVPSRSIIQPAITKPSA